MIYHHHHHHLQQHQPQHHHHHHQQQQQQQQQYLVEDEYFNDENGGCFANQVLSYETQFDPAGYGMEYVQQPVPPTTDQQIDDYFATLVNPHHHPVQGQTQIKIENVDCVSWIENFSRFFSKTFPYLYSLSNLTLHTLASRPNRPTSSPDSPT